MMENETTTVWPEVLKAISHCMRVDTAPYSETLMHPDDNSSIEDEISGKQLEGTSLSMHDWRKAQASDRSINFIVEQIHQGQTDSQTSRKK